MCGKGRAAPMGDATPGDCATGEAEPNRMGRAENKQTNKKQHKWHQSLKVSQTDREQALVVDSPPQRSAMVPLQVVTWEQLAPG